MEEKEGREMEGKERICFVVSLLVRERDGEGCEDKKLASVRRREFCSTASRPPRLAPSRDMAPRPRSCNPPAVAQLAEASVSLADAGAGRLFCAPSASRSTRVPDAGAPRLERVPRVAHTAKSPLRRGSSISFRSGRASRPGTHSHPPTLDQNLIPWVASRLGQSLRTTRGTTDWEQKHERPATPGHHRPLTSAKDRQIDRPLRATTARLRQRRTDRSNKTSRTAKVRQTRAEWLSSLPWSRSLYLSLSLLPSLPRRPQLSFC